MMRLRIENLAKVKYAQIDLEGITVIAGNNNTGKSTVGKVLYAICNSMLNFSERVKRDRYLKCLAVLREVMPRVTYRRMAQASISGDLISDFLSKKKSDAEIKYTLDALARARGASVDTQEMMEQLNEVRAPSDLMMQKHLIHRYFFSIFSGQYLSITNSRKGALVDLNIDGAEVRVMLRKDTISYKSNVAILHPAYYIDSPNLLNAIEDEQVDLLPPLSSALLRALRKGVSTTWHQDRSIVADVLSDLKFKTIVSKLSEVLEGQLEVNEVGELVYRPNKNNVNLDLSNMSQGLKAFGLLLSSIKYGAITEGDIVILDEPEIHLHPDWQIRYAELIVLIQRALDLTVLLTSHSADFIQAIKLYSKKYGTFDRVNAYVSSVNKSGEAIIEQVNHEDWDDVFSRFEKSFDLLMRIEDELE